MPKKGKLFIRNLLNRCLYIDHFWEEDAILRTPSISVNGAFASYWGLSYFQNPLLLKCILENHIHPSELSTMCYPDRIVNIQLESFQKSFKLLHFCSVCHWLCPFVHSNLEFDRFRFKKESKNRKIEHTKDFLTELWAAVALLTKAAKILVFFHKRNTIFSNWVQSCKVIFSQICYSGKGKMHWKMYWICSDSLSLETFFSLLTLTPVVLKDSSLSSYMISHCHKSSHIHIS